MSTLCACRYLEDGQPVLGAVSYRSVSYPSSPGEPTVRSAFAPVDDDATYTVAVTSYLAGGGDGYSMLKGLPATPLSKTQTELTVEYLADFGPVTQPIPMPDSGRILQKPAVVVLQLGVMCNQLTSETTFGAAARLDELEECGQIQHAISVINDKNDGLFDDLLPNAVIVSHTATTSCGAISKTRAALDELRAELPAMNAVIGPSCSGDVAELTKPCDAGLQSQLTCIPPPQRPAFISGVSTASSLGDESNYTGLARTVTPDSHTAQALQALASLYSWSQIAIVHESTQWASEAAAAFKTRLMAENPEATVLNEGDEEFILEELCTYCTEEFFGNATVGGATVREKIVDASTLLRRLETSGARIIFLAANPRTTREIMAAVYREKRLFGAGYGWLLGWVADDMFYNDNSFSLNEDALRGAEGCLGFRESVDTSTPTYKTYMEVRAAAWGRGSRPRPFAVSTLLCSALPSQPRLLQLILYPRASQQLAVPLPLTRVCVPLTPPRSLGGPSRARKLAAAAATTPHFRPIATPTAMAQLSAPTPPSRPTRWSSTPRRCTQSSAPAAAKAAMRSTQPSRPSSRLRASEAASPSARSRRTGSADSRYSTCRRAARACAAACSLQAFRALSPLARIKRQLWARTEAPTAVG